MSGVFDIINYLKGGVEMSFIIWQKWWKGLEHEQDRIRGELKESETEENFSYFYGYFVVINRYHSYLDMSEKLREWEIFFEKDKILEKIKEQAEKGLERERRVLQKLENPTDKLEEEVDIKVHKGEKDAYIKILDIYADILKTPY